MIKVAALKSPTDLLKAVAILLKKNVKGTVLLGGKEGYETGISIELLESKSDKWILNGWTLDAFGSKRSIGAGIAKDIVSTDFFKLDAGVYVTREFKKFFSKDSPTDVRVGLSGSWRF